MWYNQTTAHFKAMPSFTFICEIYAHIKEGTGRDGEAALAGGQARGPAQALQQSEHTALALMAHQVAAGAQTRPQQPAYPEPPKHSTGACMRSWGLEALQGG